MAEIQTKVRTIFKTIGEDVGSERWRVVDAGRGEVEVTQHVLQLVGEVIGKEKDPVGRLWQD